MELRGKTCCALTDQHRARIWFRLPVSATGRFNPILSVGREYEDIGYRVEGNRLLANQNVIYLRYLFRNEDESTWDSSLVNLAEAFMAAKLAYAVTGSASLRDSLTQEAAYLLRQAKSIDGQEEPPETLDGYPTYESRF